MRLKRVRIFGFKTFADRTEFDLDGDLIAVVGPNGCGKSNLVDAILWGLGEGNARQLRAATGQDVIFNGSANRKPVGFAEVVLLFDNEDGALPVESAEVSVTRRLNRAGESEYMINRQACRLRDIFDLLADSGLGRSGYSIVGQKEIDQALLASPEDRRAWLDEAAGVQRYRARKVESLRRLSSAADHLARVGDIIAEIESQREPLKEEAEIAVRYKSALGSLREVESGLLAKEIAKAFEEVSILEAEIDQKMHLAKDELQRADTLENENRSAASSLSRLEKDLEAIRLELQASLTSIERSESAGKLAEQKLASLDHLEGTLFEDAESMAARLLEAETEVEQARREEDSEIEALEALRREFAEAGEESELLANALKEAEAALEEARAIQAKAYKAEAEQAHRAERRKLVKREIKGIVEAIPDLETATAEAKTAFDEIQSKIKALIEESNQKDQSIREAAAEEERQAQNIRAKLAERAAIEGRIQGIQATIEAHEGLQQGARAVLLAVEQGQLKGRFIPVGQAIEVDKEFALAIETALGGAANDLIVDSPEDAKRAIELLKAERLGRATFQPIPLMRPEVRHDDFVKLLMRKGVLGAANELCRCENRDRPVIDSLLGGVLVVEDLDTAFSLTSSRGWNRAVTLEGEVVHHRGSVTGGQSARSGYGLVQRRADLLEAERSLADLHKAVQQAAAKSSVRDKESEKVKLEIAELIEQIKALRPEEDEARSWLRSVQEELDSARRSQVKLQSELDDLAADLDIPSAGDIAGMEAARNELMRNFAAKTSDASQAEARLREAEMRASQAQLRHQLAIRRLESSKENETSRERRLANLGPERSKAQAEIEAAEKNREIALRERDRLQQSLYQAQQERQAKHQETAERLDLAQEARKNAQVLTDAMHQAELSRARADARKSTNIQRLMEEYGMSEAEALDLAPNIEVPADAAALVSRLRRELRAMGDVNLGAIEAFERLTTRSDELGAQREDILAGIKEVEASIRELDQLTRDKFVSTFEAVREAFGELFLQLFSGGEGKLSLNHPDNILESGIEIDVTLPGKKKQRLELLSGGERSLCATAFLFSLLRVKPSPLVVLDEVDAPLDGRNVEKFVDLLKSFAGPTQFIIITHNPTTIESTSMWLGVTMQEPGVSTLVPARLPANSQPQYREGATSLPVEAIVQPRQTRGQKATLAMEPE